MVFPYSSLNIPICVLREDCLSQECDMEILKQFVGFSGSSTEVKVDLNMTLKTLSHKLTSKSRDELICFGVC